MYFFSPSIILLAVVLDLILGDPVWLYHPVRIIGWLTKQCEPFFRSVFNTHRRLGGAVFSIFIIATVTLCVTMITWEASLISWRFGVMTQVVFIALALAVNSLAAEGRIIHRYLKNGQIESARERVQNIVSRNMSPEGKNGIIRATLESLTENLSDGVIAPLFFAALGGAPGIWFYKTVNTLDSMIGYKNEQYREFGWFAARLDDILNFIPARLTGFLMVLVAAISGKNYRLAWLAWRRDAQKGPSPNGGIPIVTFAGAQDISLGGSYFDQSGQSQPLPVVGGKRQELKLTDIDTALFFHYAATSLFLVIYFLVWYMVLINF